MTPPFALFNRRPLAPSPSWPRPDSAPQAPTPDNSAFLQAYQTSLDHYSASGLNILRRAAGANSDGRLDEGVATCEAQALAGNPRLFATALRLRTSQLARATNVEERDAVREASRSWAQRALRAVENSALPVDERAMVLYDCAVALGTLLQPENPGTALPDADRALLRSFFLQIHSLLDRSGRGESVVPPPDYLESYAEAQLALLDDTPRPRVAFQQFLETRRRLAEPSPFNLHDNISDSTEAALLNFPRQTQGIQRQNLRSYYGLYALLLFNQVDGGNAEAAEALLSAAADRLQGVGRGNNVRPLLQFLASDESLGESARQVARRLLEVAGREPYATVLRRDGEDRPLNGVVNAILSSAPLRRALITALRAPADVEPIELALLLTEYGTLSEDILASLPPELAGSESLRRLRSSLRALSSEGEDGVRLGLEIPLQAMLQSLNQLTIREERYAPAYAQIFRDMSEGPNATALPRHLRQEAGRALRQLVDFNPSRLLRHLTSTESLLTLFAGIALAELAPLALLRFARNGGIFLRGGRLTWQAELANGIGIGLATSTLGAIHHLSVSPRPLGEELGEMWPAFALNTLTAGLAMGGTMLAGHGLRRWLFPEGVATQIGLRTVALRGGTFLSGGSLMLGGHALAETALTGHWRTPSAEEAVETYASMALWDLGAAGLRQIGHRYWWRAQLGPQRLRSEIHLLVNSLEQHNPWLVLGPRERRGLENYLGRRLVEGQNLTEVYRGFAENRIPRWNGQRLVFEPNETAPSTGDTGFPLTPEEWARLATMPMRDEARQILHDPRLRPVVRVEAGERTFYLSRILHATREQGSTRRFALALTPVSQDGLTHLKNRFFYLSGSDVGGWRASPAALGDGHILKGPRHYTQDTQVVPELLHALATMDTNRSLQQNIPYETLAPYITVGEEGVGVWQSNINRFIAELKFPNVQGLTDIRNLQPGQAFAVEGNNPWGNWQAALGEPPATQGNGLPIVEQLSRLHYPHGFVPDFTQEPRRIFTIPESLLGPVTFREYNGGYLVQGGSGNRSRPIIWMMGEDTQGRAWVKWIRYADVGVNSFGLYQEVIDSGILTSKPLEYLDQTGALPRAYRPRFNETYVDITPALSLLQPIREYMAARGLTPRDPQYDGD